MSKRALAVVGLMAVTTVIPAAQAATGRHMDTDAAKAGDRVPTDSVMSDPRMAAQAAAQGVSNEIDIAARKHGLEGFTGLRVAPDKVWLHWKSDVPAEITGIIEDAPPQVEVEVVPARFSLDEFLAAARNVAQETLPEVTVTSAGPARDFAALNVTTMSPIPAEHVDTLRAVAGGIPLRFAVGPAGTPLQRAGS